MSYSINAPKIDEKKASKIDKEEDDFIILWGKKVKIKDLKKV